MAMSILVHQIHLEDYLYSISDEFNNLIFIEENINMPYFFQIDSELEVKSIFIPRKEYPNETDNYLNSLFN